MQFRFDWKSCVVCTEGFGNKHRSTTHAITQFSIFITRIRSIFRDSSMSREAELNIFVPHYITFNKQRRFIEYREHTNISNFDSINLDPTGYNFIFVHFSSIHKALRLLYRNRQSNASVYTQWIRSLQLIRMYMVMVYCMQAQPLQISPLRNMFSVIWAARERYPEPKQFCYIARCTLNTHTHTHNRTANIGYYYDYLDKLTLSAFLLLPWAINKNALGGHSRWTMDKHRLQSIECASVDKIIGVRRAMLVHLTCIIKFYARTIVFGRLGLRGCRWEHIAHNAACSRRALCKHTHTESVRINQTKKLWSIIL